MSSALKRVSRLTCWKGAVEPRPLSGGITNQNFVVEDAGERYFVRIGDDIPVHGVMRFNELAASRAAAAAGISPEVVHHEPGALVMGFIEGETLDEARVREPASLERIVPLIKRCHDEIPKHLRGPTLMFWVFQVVRDYAGTLRDGNSRMLAALPRLLELSSTLEREVGPVQLVFGHNDLLAANFIDDGERLWLIDWDYAGFNSALFDLGGLASNNQLSPDQEAWVLGEYFGAPADAALMRRYQAMKCASLLRESMWSMVSEIHSHLDFDYVAYTDENLARFESAWSAFQARNSGGA
ncbi:MAG: phosphotransferase [Gammaproteobacteria bacterium]|jgi:thiamine kinase-like enzyme|nr:phosphotransferase [Gammaproteobacteria bacterium]NCF80425.1 phosphotransferase [Pseudomonadota bacterium]